MTYAHKKNEEHAFKRIDADVRRNEIPSVVLLCGKEHYLVDWAVGLIVKKYVNEAVRTIDFIKLTDEDVSFDRITESCETLSMFSERRVVLVPDFALMEGRHQKGFTDEDENRLSEYIKCVPESTVLVITCSVPERRRKLYRACASEGRIYDFDTLCEKDLKAFIIKRFKMAGKFCRNTVINDIIEKSGYYNKETDYNLYNLENDLKKIIFHSEGNEIISSDVLGIMSGDTESYIFALMDSISTGRKGEAYRLLYSILGKGENVFRILSMIISQYELTLDVKELRNAGMNRKDIIDTLGVHEYRVKKAMSVGERYSDTALRTALSRAYDTDKNIKTGLIDQNLAIEMLIASI